MKRQLIPILIALAAGVAVGKFLLVEKPAKQGTKPATTDENQLGFAVSDMEFYAMDEAGVVEARQRALRAHEMLVEGADFADVARSRSDNAAAGDGGFLGFIHPTEDSTFSGVVQSLRPGDVSPVIRTRAGWQIIKRHRFEEGRQLEQKYWVPVHGFFVGWQGMPRAGNRTRAQAKQLAEEAKRKLAAGELTLDEAASMYRGERPPRPGAYIGLFANRPKSRAIYEALVGKLPGAIVGPVQTELGWAVLIRGRPLRSLVRHIMVQHALSDGRRSDVVRTPDEARARAEEVLSKLEPGGKNWDSLVEAFSDDMRGLRNHGTIGVLTNGDILPGFESIIYDLAPGEIADRVVQSPMGFHIVWKVN